MHKLTKYLSLFLLILLVGCGSADSTPKAEAPFDYSERMNYKYDEALELFKSAEFTNITTEEISTTSEDKENVVTMVSVDGSQLFSKGKKYNTDVPVVITYYALKDTEVKEETASEDNEPKTEESTQPVMENYSADAESLKKLAEDLFKFEYSDLDVTFDDFDEAYVVSYTDDQIYNTTSFVNQNLNRYINYCRFAYQINGLTHIRFDVTLEGMDQYGKDYNIIGVSEIMRKDTFEKFDWDNLFLQNIWDVMNDESDYCGIAPEIISDIDTGKIAYDNGGFSDGCIY
nr:hypothetical protein [uncultured Butyrivibrio sp.]